MEELAGLELNVLGDINTRISTLIHSSYSERGESPLH